MDYTRIITSRGNPDRPSLDGKEFEMVHLQMPELKDGTSSGDYPFCQTGAYNIRWTRFQKLVTCPNCMKADISIHEIDGALDNGGYQSLRWAVIGPHDELQKFKTKNNAMKYRAIRKRCRNALEALKLYRREVLGKSV